MLFSTLFSESKSEAICNGFLVSNVIRYVIFFFFSTGSSNTQSVYQAANVMSAQVGESVTMDCKITVSYTYYNMYWYRQLSSGEMTHIIQLHSLNRNSRDGRYSVLFQKPTLKLTISAVIPGDSAVYFCAVAQDPTVRLVMGRALQKPLGLSTSQLLLQEHGREQPTGQEKGRQKAW